MNTQHNKKNTPLDLSNVSAPAAKQVDSQLILFLDFDGVLNNSKFLTHQTNHTKDKKFFDPNNIAALNTLCESGIVKSIIISSSWRQGRALDELKALLAEEDFKYSQLIHDVTPSTGTRAEDITTWLAQSKNLNKHYLVIDDSMSLLGSGLNLLKTNPFEGLRQTDVQALIAKHSKASELQEE